jgi:hypothetical protein
VRSFWGRTLRRFPGGKDGRCVGLTTLPPSCVDCLEILGASTFWNPKGLSRPVAGKLYLLHSDGSVGRFSRRVVPTRNLQEGSRFDSVRLLGYLDHD